MKIKKKHFKKLKEIAVAVNQIVPGTGIRLDKLIAEIESVQKVPVEDLIYAMHRKDVEGNIQKELDVNPIHQAIKKGLRKQREAIDRAKAGLGNQNFREFMHTPDTAPQLGDVGYFWDNDINGVYYCILKEIKPNGDYVARTSLGTFNHFSKTPPELK